MRSPGPSSHAVACRTAGGRRRAGVIDDPLGPAGRARGVDARRRGRRAPAPARRVESLARPAIVRRVARRAGPPRAVAAGSGPASAAVGHQHGERRRRSSMKARRSRGIGGVERHVGAAGLEDREQADDQLRRALEAEADQHLRADARARGRWWASRLARAVELAVGQRSASLADRAPTASGRARRPGLRRARGRSGLAARYGRGRCRSTSDEQLAALGVGRAAAARTSRRAGSRRRAPSAASRDSAPAGRSTVAASNRSVLYSSVPRRGPSARLGERRRVRSNLRGAAVALRAARSAQAGHRAAPGLPAARSASANITWNSGVSARLAAGAAAPRPAARTAGPGGRRRRARPRGRGRAARGSRDRPTGRRAGPAC